MRSTQAVMEINKPVQETHKLCYSSISADPLGSTGVCGRFVFLGIGMCGGGSDGPTPPWKTGVSLHRNPPGPSPGGLGLAGLLVVPCLGLLWPGPVSPALPALPWPGPATTTGRLRRPAAAAPPLLLLNLLFLNNNYCWKGGGPATLINACNFHIDLYVTLKLCRRNPVYQNGPFVVVAFRVRGVDFFRKLIFVILRNRSFGVRKTTGHESL